MTHLVAKTACGGIINNPSQYPSAEYKGETVYFCVQACLNAFLRDPEAFMSGEIEHPLEEDETATTSIEGDLK